MKKNLLAMWSLVLGIAVSLTGCSDDEEYESKLPVFDRVELQTTQAAPGDVVSATIHFKETGSYIKGTYTWTLGNVTSGEVEASSNQEKTFAIAIPDEAPAGTYTLTVKPRTMAAYAGDAPYLDPTPMGEVTTRLTILTTEQE